MKTFLQRWMGILGLASVIGFGVPLLLRDRVAPPTRYALEAVAFLVGVQLFHPTGWRRLLAGAVVMVAATLINSLPVMNTTVANVLSWAGIVAAALAVSLWDRHHARPRSDARGT
jgi:hypothetical protein